jgi:ATP-binding cassette, subfamily F, member 3
MLASLNNVTLEFGSRILLDTVNWSIFENERIGLIGYNGTGKSTILKLLNGNMVPSNGTIEKSKETSIGYLHQDLLSLETEESILQVAKGAFAKQLALEKEIAQLTIELENSTDEDLLMKYADKLHDFEVLGGYEMDHQTEDVLQGLGFKNKDLQRPFKEFSGGWRMRVILAKMILQKPDLLMLDEPTNHLDLPSIEWLEKYLQHYQGTVIIVSHDKYFLNRMVTKIVELYQRELHFYTGDYENYEREKEMRLELQQRAFENQQDYIRQQERFVERFKAKASKAAAAQSIVKRLDKIERIEEASLERPSLRINFKADVVPGKVLCELKNVTKKFPTVDIVDGADAEIERGDKIALIGANGKGKSTLLRVVVGTESFEGERKWGHNIVESFYAQHQLESLDVEDTIIAEMMNCGSQKTELELRSLLGAFLFSGDDVTKKIKVLSGGEKARIALAKTIVSKANFLLLDEPTNHLDLVSIELLIEALNKYDGSFIMVSHDRYFIRKTANKIWEIVDGKIKEFKGGYDEYLEWQERMAEKNPELSGNKKKITNDKVVAPKVIEQKKEEVIITTNKPINKELKKEHQKQQRILEQMEEKINLLKKDKENLELSLSLPETYTDKNKFADVETNYKKAKEEVAKLEKEYELQFEKVMELEMELEG